MEICVNLSDELKMNVTLIISTYNWKEALYLVLLSVKRQVRIPNEVIIADDGSNEDTRIMIDKVRTDFPCRLIHVWKKHENFHKSSIMNKAFSISKGEYIIQIDGDIIIDKNFVKDHASSSRKGYFLHGSRGKLNYELTNHITKTGDYDLHFYTSGLRHKINVMRMPLLTPFFYMNKDDRGCNMSFWRRDVMNVNGYDERIKGYGWEDIDLSERLRRSGIKFRFIKFKAIEYHLEHKCRATTDVLNRNGNIFSDNNTNNITYVLYGIVKPNETIAQSRAKARQQVREPQ